MKKIVFVILNYNNTSDTLSCLTSLQEIIIPEDTICQIFVVDNASKMRVDEISSFKFKKSNNLIYKFIQNKNNLGFSGGNNIGIREALDDQADYVGLLNNDTVVDKNFLKNMLEGLKESDVVVPKIYFLKGSEFHKSRYSKNELGHIIWYAGGIMDWNNVLGTHRGVDEVDKGQYDLASTTDFLTGCCMLAKAKVWQNVGLLDDRYFLYYEDSDYSMRIKKRGYKILFYPKSFIYHKNAGSTGGSGSDLQDYYISRNRLLFGINYAPLKSKIHLILEGIRLIVNGRIWQKRGVIDFFTGRFGKGSFTRIKSD